LSTVSDIARRQSRIEPEPGERTFAEVFNGLWTGAARRGGDKSTGDAAAGRPVAGRAPAREPIADGAGTGSADDGRPADGVADDAAIVRPYAWTGGRTESETELRVEAMVSTTDRAADDTLLTTVEHRTIAWLCQQPRSVAEVASALAIPPRVAMVVLGDMVEAGLLTTHRIARMDGSASHLALMERVLSGLRRL